MADGLMMTRISQLVGRCLEGLEAETSIDSSYHGKGDIYRLEVGGVRLAFDSAVKTHDFDMYYWTALARRLWERQQTALVLIVISHGTQWESFDPVVRDLLEHPPSFAQPTVWFLMQNESWKVQVL